ncbi:peptidoglycan recognition protein family protein [Nonomuraea guangzhouensis]|uniref:N-acetylmuramoyl-L-alanine amidase n=1 Tax=Nonomuraea guangzhouensis TaxID=1291555 RepID=A0ABW4H082_9ACTN|nr:peptidoglycan-binding domain-containing protein [Nonomuraea guangzhouensis]
MKTVQAKHYHKGRIAPIRLIVMHSMEWAETATTAEDCARMFATMSREASAHVTVDSNSVVRCVADKDTAWAAPGANADGLQVELAGFAKQKRDDWLDDYSRSMLKQAAAVTAGWCKLYKIPVRKLSRAELKAGGKGFTSHADVSAVYKRSDHSDPGTGFPWDVFLDLVRDAMAGEDDGDDDVAIPAWTRRLTWPPTTKGDDVKVWQRQMRKRGWRIDVDGWFAEADEDVCKAFQKEKGIPATGAVDRRTWDAAWTAPIT